jgi:hypothetical protein
MFKVEGYEFETKEQAQAAAQEVEQIKYLREQTGKDDPDVVLTLYNKLVERHTFSTKIGLDYLIELKKYLDAVPYIKSEDILPLPTGEKQPARAKKNAKPEIKKQDIEDDPEYERRRIQREQAALLRQEIKSRDHYKKMFHISTFFAVVFAVAIIGMVVITVISKDNVNIVNYENSLIDKYESWEQELNEREAQLELREQQVNGQATNGQEGTE